MTTPSLITEAQIDAAVEAQCRRQWAPHELPLDPDLLATVRETARLMLEAAAREPGLSLTPPAAGWDAVAAAQDLWGEWQRNSTQEDYIHFLARHLTLARSTAPSAEAMREAAATLLDQHRAVIQQATKTANETEAMIYMAQVEYLEETAAIVRALPLPPTQPPAEARMNTDKLAAYYKGIFDHGALKGAGAMREAAAQECFDRQADRHGDHEDAWNEACLHCCERVRALPLPPAQPFAPSAEAMREAAVKSIRDDKFQWRSHEHGVTVGLALTDAAVRVSLLPLTLTQPSAVGDATHDPYGHVKCWAFPPGCDTIEACKAANECAKAHPSSTTGYQPAAGPTQGHPGHGATMDGVPLVTLEVPVGEIEAVPGKYRAFELAGPLDVRTGNGMWAIDTATVPMRPVARCLGKDDAQMIVTALNGGAALSSIPAAEIEALRKAVGEAIDTFEGKLHSEKIDAILVILGRLQSPTPAGEATE